MERVTDSTAVELELPPPPPEDFITHSYGKIPSNISHDINRSFSNIDDDDDDDEDEHFPPPPPPLDDYQQDDTIPTKYQAQQGTGRSFLLDNSVESVEVDEGSFKKDSEFKPSDEESLNCPDHSLTNVSRDKPIAQLDQTIHSNVCDPGKSPPLTNNTNIEKQKDPTDLHFPSTDRTKTDHSDSQPSKDIDIPNHLSNGTKRNPRSKVSCMDHSLDNVVLAEQGFNTPVEWQHDREEPQLEGLDNEAYAYDGDEDTDLSHSFHTNPSEFPVMRNPDPAFPVLERPVSGRYQKNPALEKAKPPLAQGPYDPHIGVFLTPPLPKVKPDVSSCTKVRRRIPRPPSKLKMKCAFFWSCLACFVGNFLCAIPALRYAVTASESRKIGDYNSAHSYLRKTAVLATVGMALGVGVWIVVILHLSASF